MLKDAMDYSCQNLFASPCWLHLFPQRDLHQYGYVQMIPRHPSVVKDGDLTTNEMDR